MRLELEGITAGYGEVIALRDVSLVVPEGAVVALLGANGAGKTTLLSVASGLISPRTGHVLADDMDVTGYSLEQRAQLGICHVTEGRSVFRGLSVKDNLRMFAPRGGEEGNIERAIAAFPVLGRRLGQMAGTLSGGEQQMLALARAYVQRPEVILLDEVSMGLAPKIVDEIFAFLHRLASEGTALLIVEQYVRKALELAQYVYVLSRGRLVLLGEPGEFEDGDLVTQYLAISS